MTTSMVMDMNLGEKNGVKQSVNGSGRRKTKGSELTQKKNKPPQRGMGVEQLERVRLQEERKKLTEAASLHRFALPPFNSSVAFTTSSYTPLPNAGVHQLRPAQPPAMLYHGIAIHGANLYSPVDHVMDPSVIGSSNYGFRFENSKELASIPNYNKYCASDDCGVCHKKKRIHSGSNACISVNSFLNLAGNSSIDSAKTRRQVTEVMSVNRSGGGSGLTEYEFFPRKSGRGKEYKEFMRIGTGVEEGSFSSVDLSLKL